MVRELFGRLGYRVEMVVLGNWQRCLLDAAEGRVDVVLAYASEQRAKSMRFSQVPVLREEVAVFANRQHPLQFDQLEDLARYRGGLLFGKAMARHSTASWRSTRTSNGCRTAGRTSAS